jgi:hypothetical protein
MLFCERNSRTCRSFLRWVGGAAPPLHRGLPRFGKACELQPCSPELSKAPDLIFDALDLRNAIGVETAQTRIAILDYGLIIEDYEHGDGERGTLLPAYERR